MDRIIKLTNRLALFAIALLVYWVFVFISITVFNFKIFRENITEVFYLSVVAIFALLGAAIIVNVMFNLTKISTALSANKSEIEKLRVQQQPIKRRAIIAFLLSFPLIFALLFLGDFGSAQKRQAILLNAAEDLVENNQPMLAKFSDYRFVETYLQEVSESLQLLSRIDENFPDISLIVEDKIAEKQVFLKFNQYYNNGNEPRKIDFIYSSSPEERLYLQQAFEQQQSDSYFSAHDGFYELYYPVIGEGKPLVLYFSDQNRYGKYGSS
ncbi:MAG: hypothetical protein WBG70_24690 [Spirulinaceae cyanobacterium]